MSYKIKCNHCKGIVIYAGIWEAELGHNCKEQIAHDNEIFSQTTTQVWIKSKKRNKKAANNAIRRGTI